MKNFETYEKLVQTVSEFSMPTNKKTDEKVFSFAVKNQKDPP